jgi:hypothetical protein
MIVYGFRKAVEIPVNNIILPADLAIPKNATAIIVFAHGSGTLKHLMRLNRSVS